MRNLIHVCKCARVVVVVVVARAIWNERNLYCMTLIQCCLVYIVRWLNAIAPNDCRSSSNFDYIKHWMAQKKWHVLCAARFNNISIRKRKHSSFFFNGANESKKEIQFVIWQKKSPHFTILFSHCPHLIARNTHFSHLLFIFVIFVFFLILFSKQIDIFIFVWPFVTCSRIW